jgi:hypothetical protein
MTKKKSIPEDLAAKLLVESRKTCNICWKSKEVQIHHITPIESGGNNSEDNLIVLCLNCHSAVHTKRLISRNVHPTTLRLYKETWLDLISRYPLLPHNIIDQENDLDTIREILKQGHRRALYFPFHLEIAVDMFRSFDDFRLFLQKVGYKLLKNDRARDHATQLYKALVEISFLAPKSPGDFPCLHGMLGQEGLALLELKRKMVCFHLNEMARLAGFPEDLVSDDEFTRMHLDTPRRSSYQPRCFSSFSDTRPECQRCEYRAECIEATSSQ